MNVRPFTPDDAENLSHLIIQNLRQVLIHDYPHAAIEALVPFFTPDTIREWPEHQIVLVGTLGNHVVGDWLCARYATLQRDTQTDSPRGAR